MFLSTTVQSSKFNSVHYPEGFKLDYDFTKGRNLALRILPYQTFIITNIAGANGTLGYFNNTQIGNGNTFNVTIPNDVTEYTATVEVTRKATRSTQNTWCRYTLSVTFDITNGTITFVPTQFTTASATAERIDSTRDFNYPAPVLIVISTVI